LRLAGALAQFPVALMQKGFEEGQAQFAVADVFVLARRR
jgi:hypothetical protein